MADGSNWKLVPADSTTADLLQWALALNKNEAMTGRGPAEGIEWQQALALRALAEAQGLTTQFMWAMDLNSRPPPRTSSNPRRVCLAIDAGVSTGEGLFRAKFCAEGMVEVCAISALSGYREIDIDDAELKADRDAFCAQWEWSYGHRAELQQWRQNERLLLAVQRRQLENARVLLADGAQVDCTASFGGGEEHTDDTTEMTPLMCAASRGYRSMVMLLLEHSASTQPTVKRLLQPRFSLPDCIDSFNRERVDALYLAAVNGHTDCVVALLDAGAESHLQDDVLMACTASEQDFDDDVIDSGELPFSPLLTPSYAFLANDL